MFESSHCSGNEPASRITVARNTDSPDIELGVSVSCNQSPTSKSPLPTLHHCESWRERLLLLLERPWCPRRSASGQTRKFAYQAPRRRHDLE